MCHMEWPGDYTVCLSTACKFQDTTTITVNVLDVNDHSPVFNSSVYYVCKCVQEHVSGCAYVVCVRVCLCVGCVPVWYV